MIKRLVPIVAVVVCLLALPAGALAVSPLHSINVYAEGGSEGANNVIATFTTTECSVKPAKGGRYFRAHATSTDGQSHLNVLIDEWHGYGQEYEIEKGSPENTPSVQFYGPSGVYSSAFLPPYESVGFGFIIFRDKSSYTAPAKKGELIGVGYGPAMYDATLSKAVTFTGVMECTPPNQKAKGGKHKPKKGKPGKHH